MYLYTLLKRKFHGTGKEIDPFQFFLLIHFLRRATQRTLAGDGCYLVLYTGNRLRWLFMHLFLTFVSSSGCGSEVEVSEIPDVI